MQDHVQQRETMMRMFERIRLNFGFMLIEPQNDSKETRELADVAAASPPVPAAAEGMCCGHCSGNADAHVPELPTAR
jgi:hypothetical protein